MFSADSASLRFLRRVRGECDEWAAYRRHCMALHPARRARKGHGIVQGAAGVWPLPIDDRHEGPEVLLRPRQAWLAYFISLGYAMWLAVDGTHLVQCHGGRDCGPTARVRAIALLRASVLVTSLREEDATHHPRRS